MQKVTAIKVNCIEMKALINHEEGDMEYGIQFTIQIYHSYNKHLSLNEIAKLIPAGDSEMSIVQVI